MSGLNVTDLQYDSLISSNNWTSHENSFDVLIVTLVKMKETKIWCHYYNLFLSFKDHDKFIM